MWRVVLAVAIVACAFQLWWFGRICFHEIDFDGMAYTGIARHLREGHFHAAINAFASPLLAWLIAAFHFGSGNEPRSYVMIGKIVNVACFLLAATLTFVLAGRLWRSRLAGSVAVLLFVLGRGVAASAVEIVTPDFLFAALVLSYFILLLRALQRDSFKDWFLPGAVHGIAFLAKAFALPWLAVCTFAAVVVSGKPWSKQFVKLAAAALIPAVIAAGWAGALHSKYGVFTTGSQFKANLLMWTLRAYRVHHDSKYAVLTNTEPELDEYGVFDPMPPGSWTWKYHSTVGQLVPKIIKAEAHNVPQVLRELIVVATPGACLAYLFALALVMRRGRAKEYSVVRQFIVVSAIAAITLVGAYSMLVFDSRYLFPLVPLLLAVAAGFLTYDGSFHPRWRRFCQALVVLGLAISLVYRSSPFRTVTRDFEVSCYNTGRLLAEHRIAEHRIAGNRGMRIVSLGSGPFPEYGISWEAGYKSAYFGEARLVGRLDELPDSRQESLVMADVEKAAPEAILVWASPESARRAELIAGLHRPGSSMVKIIDPVVGEVGQVIFWPNDGFGQKPGNGPGGT